MIRYILGNNKSFLELDEEVTRNTLQTDPSDFNLTNKLPGIQFRE
jgi:hypothetical protein